MTKKLLCMIAALTVVMTGCGKKGNNTVSLGDSVTCPSTVEITEGEKLNPEKFCKVDKSVKSISLTSSLDTSQPGKGTATITVTDKDGNIFAKTVDVTVSKKETPTPSPTPSPTPTPTPSTAPAPAPEAPQNSNSGGNNSQSNANSGSANNYQQYQPQPAPPQNNNVPSQEQSGGGSVDIETEENSGGGSLGGGNTRYFMFSDGYDFNSARDACIAWGGSSYSCEPIANGDQVYIGYRGIKN